MEQSDHIEDLPPAITNSVRAAIREFQDHLSERLPTLRVTLLTDRTSDVLYKSIRRTGIFGKMGVYMHYSEAGECLYVGMTTNHFDRCWANDCPDRRWILAVQLDFPHDVFIPALELALIRSLRPRNNVRNAER